MPASPKPLLTGRRAPVPKEARQTEPEPDLLEVQPEQPDLAEAVDRLKLSIMGALSADATPEQRQRCREAATTAVGHFLMQELGRRADHEVHEKARLDSGTGEMAATLRSPSKEFAGELAGVQHGMQQSLQGLLQDGLEGVEALRLLKEGRHSASLSPLAIQRKMEAALRVLRTKQRQCHNAGDAQGELAALQQYHELHAEYSKFLILVEKLGHKKVTEFWAAKDAPHGGLPAQAWETTAALITNNSVQQALTTAVLGGNSGAATLLHTLQSGLDSKGTGKAAVVFSDNDDSAPHSLAAKKHHRGRFCSYWGNTEHFQQWCREWRDMVNKFNGASGSGTQGGRCGGGGTGGKGKGRFDHHKEKN